MELRIESMFRDLLDLVFEINLYLNFFSARMHSIDQVTIRIGLVPKDFNDK